MNLFGIAWRSTTFLTCASVFAPILGYFTLGFEEVIVAAIVLPCIVSVFLFAFWGLIWSVTPGDWWEF